MIQNGKMSWFRIVDLCVCVCVCVCVFLVWGIQRGKKWFGIAAERTRRGMWLKMDKKDYHWEANWKWKQYLCGHTHLNCNGIFSMGTPSFISLFICSANINGCLASAKHSSRPPRHSDEKDKQGHCPQGTGEFLESISFKCGRFTPRKWHWVFFFFFFWRMGKTQPSQTWCKNLLGIRGMEVSLRLKNRCPYNQLFPIPIKSYHCNT